MLRYTFTSDFLFLLCFRERDELHTIPFPKGYIPQPQSEKKQKSTRSMHYANQKHHEQTSTFAKPGQPPTRCDTLIKPAATTTITTPETTTDNTATSHMAFLFTSINDHTPTPTPTHTSNHKSRWKERQGIAVV